MHVDDLFLLIEECLCALSEWSDAQEAPSKKGTAASIDRHPEATPSRHPDNVDIHYGFALVRVCRSCIRLHCRRVQVNVSSPSPAAAFSASSQVSPRARERVRVSTPSATTTSASSMSSQAYSQARRDRVSNYGRRHLSWWWLKDCMTG